MEGASAGVEDWITGSKIPQHVATLLQAGGNFLHHGAVAMVSASMLKDKVGSTRRATVLLLEATFDAMLWTKYRAKALTTWEVCECVHPKNYYFADTSRIIP